MDITERRQRVAGAMKEQGLDFLVALSSAHKYFDHPNPVAFLAEYWARGESALVLSADGEVTLIATPASDADRLADRCPDIGHVATNDPVEAIGAALGTAAGVARVGVAGWETFPLRYTERLKALLGDGRSTFDDGLYAVDRSKTAGELARARKATAIAEDGFRLLLETARPGMTEHELALVLNDHMKEIGADDNFTMMSSLPMARGVMPPGGRRLQVGDQVLAELTPSYERQYVQVCRTAVIGEPTRQLSDIYDLVVRAMWNGILRVKPGVRMSEVCRGVDEVLTEAGYGDYCRPPYIRRRGHGFGAGSDAPGDVAVDNDTVLEPGMLFIVHPNQYLPETGYLLCGEPLVVTDDGFEVLSRKTAELGVVGI